MLAFAGDHSLHVYRLKGRLHLTDATAILLHKVGSEIIVENTTDNFETCGLVAIGTRPFRAKTHGAAWARLIHKGGVISSQN